MESTPDLKTVQKYVQVIGIDAEVLEVFLQLSKIGPSSALQVAKQTGITRTQVYRHLEALEAKGLVSTEQLSYGSLFRTLPFENIERLLADKQAETAYAQQNLSTMIQMMHALSGNIGTEATIQHYYGLAGLRQVNWNLTKAKSDYRVFTAAHLNQYLNSAFARMCREHILKRGIVSYALVNIPVVTAAEMEPYEQSRTHLRYIDPTVLPIKFEMYLYDDTVTFLDYSDSQQMALEIHHPALFAMMRQLFDGIWQTAMPIEIQK